VHEGINAFINTLFICKDPITTLAITKSKHFIVSACYDGSFHILDLQCKDLVHSYKPHEGEDLSGVLYLCITKAR
jgi:WD40 repeat protein